MDTSSTTTGFWPFTNKNDSVSHDELDEEVKEVELALRRVMDGRDKHRDKREDHLRQDFKEEVDFAWKRVEQVEQQLKNRQKELQRSLDDIKKLFKH
jgi:hypothetical protein